MELGFGFIGLALLILVVLLVLVSCVKIVPQAQAMVVERLGAYLDTWEVGVHFKTPFIDRVAKRVRSIRSYFSRSPIRSFTLTAWRTRSWRSRT